MINQSVDVLIVGGGLTGATLLLAMQGLGYSTLLLESKPLAVTNQTNFDARSLALSPATQRVLNTLGVWPEVAVNATPIEMIHVSEKSGFAKSRLHAQEDGPLGYVIEMPHISKALHDHLPKEQVLAPATLTRLDIDQKTAYITTPDGDEYAIKAQLIVAADGVESSIRRWCGLGVSRKEFHQNAIVANVACTLPHDHRAFERFLPEGPMALLPLQAQRMALVWANTPKTTQRLMALNDASFLKELQQQFGYKLGRFTKIGTRTTFPLRQILMPKQIHWPVVFIGNAAHTLHPVAGQGFNLGLRDVACLAQAIKQWGLGPDMLEHYRRMRTTDQKNIMQLTNGLLELFGSSLPGMTFARGIGLMAFDMFPALKKILTRHASGYSGIIPDLVCDIALSSEESEHES